MSYLEEGEHPVKYMFRAKMTSALYDKIIHIRKRHQNNSIMKHASYCEIQCRGTKWKKARRLIIVRVPKRTEEKRQQELFKESEQLAHYEYMAFVTTSKDSAVEVH